MFIIYLQVAGCVVFALSAFILGTWLKLHPSSKSAEKTTRIMHLIIIFIVIVPMFTGLISYPGLTHYDELLGIPSLPFPTISLVAGAVMIMFGSGLMLIAPLILLDRGQGSFLVDLTKKLAVKDIYKRTRNPMMLGLYLFCTGIGLFAGSTFFILWSLLALIPANVFFLKYFEERELEIRFGESYREYRRKVPFLIPDFRKSPESETANINGDK
jgi:protein-S-isoprenylcysteine O-methyltransferase Ste14